MKLSILLVVSGTALHLTVCAQVREQADDSKRKPEPLKLSPPVTVVLPTALQHERKVGWTWTMAKGSRLRLGLLSGRAALSEVLPSGSPQTVRTLAGIEYEQRLGGGVANFKFGALRQSNPLLGRNQADASPWSIATRTNFSSVSLGYPLDHSVSVVGMLSFGRTSGARSNASFADMRSASAAAASVGLAVRDFMREGDSAGLAIVMPTRGVGVASVDGAPSAPRGLALGMRYGFAF